MLNDVTTTLPELLKTIGVDEQTASPQHEWRSDDAVVERGRTYVATIPSAIAGNGGHNTTFHVACVLVKGFELSDSDAMAVISEWNSSCDPPWSEPELKHKIESARKASGETGYLRNAKPDRYTHLIDEKQKAIPANVGTYPLKHGANGPSADNRTEVLPKTEEFMPFPLERLPPVLRDFCTEAATSIGCDPAFAVLPALAACAAAIGTSRNLIIKYGWIVPPILWTMIVGESGSGKSPPFKLAVCPIKERQSKQADDFTMALAQYGDELDRYKAAEKAWNKKPEGDKPQEPYPPSRPRCMVVDTTIEALAPTLLDNERGVLLGRDELSGWISSFDQHGGGKGKASADAPKWLEIYNAETITIDRKTGDVRFILVKRPSVSICGGIQPDILAKCLTDELKSNGLQSRLLMAYPPRQPKRWRDEEMSQAVMDEYSKFIGDLFELKHDSDAAGNLKPALLRLSDTAKAAFKDFVNSHGAEQNALHGHLASQWSKLEEIPARLAIVLHCAYQVTEGVESAFVVGGETMADAIAITQWFKTETLRINNLLTEPDEVRAARHLVEWIKERGGRITARDLCKHRRDINTSEQAELLLMDLVGRNAGEWQTLHSSREFVLKQ